MRQPAAWWAAGCLELRWAGRKRLEQAVDGPTIAADLVRVWRIVSGEARIEHGGRSWRAGAGDWLVLPGIVVRQRLPAGTVMRSVAIAWRDADGRQALADQAPWIVPAALHRRLDAIVGAIEAWTARHGTPSPDARSPRTANREPIDAEAFGELQQRLFALVGLLVAAPSRGSRVVGDAAVARALVVLRAHAAGAYPGTAAAATAAGLGPRRLEQRFAAALGCSPRVWHRRLRLAEASQRLLGPSPAVKAVAHAVGFAGAPAFRRWFRAASGCSPLVWRRRHLEREP